MKPARLAAALLLVATFASAQDRGKGMPMPIPAGGITGHVTTVSGNLITLLNGNITIDSTGAQFNNRKGAASIADVRPGVQIVATIKNPEAGPGTMLRAGTIGILDSPAGLLTAPVQSVDVTGSSLTVLGARIGVTAATKIITAKREATPTLADVKAGDNVAVEVAVVGSALVAESILVFPTVTLPPMPVETSISGTVKTIGATSWLITQRDGRDMNVIVSSSTKIDPTIKVGDTVTVIGRHDGADSFIAIAILKTGGDPGKKRSTKG